MSRNCFIKSLFFVILLSFSINAIEHKSYAKDITNKCAGVQECLKKKIIETGWDVPYPDFIRDNIKEMEKRPFDGIIYRLNKYHHVFDLRPWKKEEFQKPLDILAEIKWDKFKDNFLLLYSANDWGMDWFNDDHWKKITRHMKLISKAAGVGGCVGVCFDPEPYGAIPWLYDKEDKNKSFEQVSAQVRLRGAQFMRAIQTHMPELKVLCYLHFSYFSHIGREPDAKIRQQKLLETNPGYALLPAFLLGMLEAAGPGVKMIDGNENSYYYTKALQ